MDEDEQRKKKSSLPINSRDSFRQYPGNTNASSPENSIHRKYSEFPTERLISLSRESADECKMIAKELNRRCGGTSVGYLTSTQLSILCEYYASSRMLQPDELLRLHTQLQTEVQQFTDHDPFEILSVPNEKLLYLAAVTLCLQNASKFQ